LFKIPGIGIAKSVHLKIEARQFSTYGKPGPVRNFVPLIALGGVIIVIYILWKLSAFLIKLALFGVVIYVLRRVWVRYLQQSTTSVKSSGRSVAAEEISQLVARMQSLRGPAGVMARLAPAFAVGVLARLLPKMANEYANTIQASRHVKGLAFRKVLSNPKVLQRLGNNIMLQEQGGSEEVHVSNDAKLIGSLEFPIRGTLGEAVVDAQYSYALLDATTKDLERAIVWKDLRVELPSGEEIIVDISGPSSGSVIDASYEVLDKNRKRK